MKQNKTASATDSLFIFSIEDPACSRFTVPPVAFTSSEAEKVEKLLEWLENTTIGDATAMEVSI